MINFLFKERIEVGTYGFTSYRVIYFFIFPGMPIAFVAYLFVVGCIGVGCK